MRVDLEIRNGRIARLAPVGSAPAAAIQLSGGLVWPGFVDIHTHLDKGHIWPRSPNPDGSFLGAAGATSSDCAAHWTKEDVHQRMEFGLHCAYAQDRSRCARISTATRSRAGLLADVHGRARCVGRADRRPGLQHYADGHLRPAPG